MDLVKCEEPLGASGKKTSANEACDEAAIENGILCKLSGDSQLNIARMNSEFANCRKISVTSIPAGMHEKELLSEMLGDENFKVVSNPKENGIRVIFPNTESARKAINKINGSKLGRISAQFGHPDSLLFVGNLPSNYNHDKLRYLFSPHGEVLRCFVVYSVLTGECKGYGFVEYATREQALITKNKMATKVVGCRSLRVDFSDNGMQTEEDLQSRTVFVDKLPKGMMDEGRLVELFNKYGMVNFCQIAMTPSGCPRGFAFVDMSSSEEAESVQKKCNGFMIDGQEIRVSYGMPCRPGACILQPRNNNPHIGVWNTKIIPANIMGTSTYSRPSSVNHFTGMPANVVLSTDSIVSIAGGDPHCPPFYPTCCSSLPPPLFTTPHVSYATVPVPVSTVMMTMTSNPNNSIKVAATAAADLDKNATSLTSEKENVPLSDKPPIVGQKRPLPDDEEVMAVYDKPYIGQHDQGIAFTHPLKRIKKS